MAASVILSTVILIIAFSGKSKPQGTVKYNVAFYDNNGELIKESKEDENGFAPPPETLAVDGYVFNGWQGSFNRVTSDTKCHPSLKAVSNDKNAIYADAHYAKAESEITVDIKLGGEAQLNTLGFYAEFDSKVWKAIEVISESGDVYIENDRIYYKSKTDDAFKSGDILLTAKFKIGKEALLYNELVFKIENALYIDSGVSKKADYSVINGKIYTY